MKILRLFAFILLLISVAPSWAKNYTEDLPLERLINDRIYAYPFSSDNLLRLAAYYEMKGIYNAEYDQMEFRFGGLGTVSIFKDRFFIRTRDQKVYHLKPDYPDPELLGLVNDALRDLFEQIPLMGNYGSHPSLIDFVDRNLAGKNLEPFDKVYLRYILLKFGRLDKNGSKVEFHTSWLPRIDHEAMNKSENLLIRKHKTPLVIYLYPAVIRGYYEKIGGTVFVEEKHKLIGKYAIGHTSQPNVASFKLFIQKLFVQSIRYIADDENDRLGEKVSLQNDITSSTLTASNSSVRPVKLVKVEWQHPYHTDSWMIMMLTILRQNKTSIGDPEIIRYFVDEPYFERLYSYMTEKERSQVDRYLLRKK
ncbi:MAG: hypothetical protein MRZ79_22860 [Bacteroidia bacterium]|nr:hypothetical protein [Bacteroidia bacterium]